MSTVLSSYDQWKKFLADRVDQAKKLGMSEDTISNLAYEIGDFLDQRVDPKNVEQRALKDLWDAGDETEKKALAKLMVKHVDNMK
jgi:Protein of unknown function (DUF3243)